jgi:hypothetical protein
MTPLSETDAQRYFLPLFRPEFASRWLGKPGVWQGGIALKRQLKDPVTPELFTRLAQARTPDGESWIKRLPFEAERTAGWQFTLSAGASLSVLWGVSPDFIRTRIRLAHNEAVRKAVVDFEYSLNERPLLNDLFVVREQHALFAKFQSGASSDQRPMLQTSLFLFNLRYRHGVMESYPPEQVNQLHSAMQAHYSRTLARQIRWVLGDRVQLPEEMCLRMHNAASGGQTDSRRRANTRPLEGQQLFAAWRKQAQEWGWGPLKVYNAISEARSRPTRENWVKDWSQKLHYGSLVVRLGLRSLRKTIIPMDKPRPSEEHSQPQKKDQSKDMGHSY